MTISSGSLVQYRNQYYITWTVTPDEPVTVSESFDDTTYTEVGTAASGTLYYVTVPNPVPDAGSTYYVRLVGVDSASAVDLSTVVEPAVVTYGEIDYLAAAPRYTTLDQVKARLGITNTDKDDRITQAILATELQMDIYMQQSFPSGGDNPWIDGIPQPIIEAATTIATSVFKQGDMPLGVGGDDAWLGTINVSDAVRAEFQRNPMMMGFKIQFGVA